MISETTEGKPELISEDNPCGIEHAYFYRQKMYNVSDWSVKDGCVRLEYFCNADEYCRIGGCGYNGVAHDVECMNWLRGEWAKTTSFGSVLMGLLAGAFILWISWAVSDMIKRDRKDKQKE
jgi:hypothetical protein